MRTLILPLGERFGRLLVLREADRKNSSRAFACQCDCGAVVIIPLHNLRDKRGPTRSCGCLHRDGLTARNSRHGFCNTPEYQVWLNAASRCTDPNNKSYRHYGGRGITFCSEWKSDFTAFLREVGPRPSPDHTLDRIDNSRGYEPGNIQWATWSTQQRNKRSNIWINYAGDNRLLVEVCAETGFDCKLARARKKAGWPDHALFGPAWSYYGGSHRTRRLRPPSPGLGPPIG
jgi:hypothetical protein